MLALGLEIATSTDRGDAIVAIRSYRRLSVSEMEKPRERSGPLRLYQANHET